MTEMDPSTTPAGEPRGPDPAEPAPPTWQPPAAAAPEPGAETQPAPVVPPLAPQVGGRDATAGLANPWAVPGAAAGQPTGATEGATLADLPAAGAASAAPVPPPAPGPARRPRGLLRWGVALVVVALLVGAVSVGAVLLTGSGVASTVEAWIPSSTIGYLEIRGDLPGDQKANLDAILARFPGFKDQASIDVKLDEALDRAFESSNITWTKDLKPWFAGEMGVVMTAGLFKASAAGMAAPATGGAAAMSVTDGLAVVMAVKDPAAADALLRAKVTGAPAAVAYNGFNLTTVEQAGVSLAWATNDKLLAIGFGDTVKAVIDTKGASSVASSASFTAAKKVASGAYLGFGYLDTKALADAYSAAMSAYMPSDGGSQTAILTCLSSSMTAAMPSWQSGVVQARDGALWMESRTAPVTRTSTPAASVSVVAPRLPATTLATFDVREAGKTIVSGWAELSKALSCSDDVKQQLDKANQALGMVGGLDGIIGWAGDASLAVTHTGTTWGGGLVTVATDAAAAKRTFTQVQALVGLAGQGSGIETSSAAYAGGQLVTLTFPAAANTPALGMALRDDLFVIGTADFAKSTLDTQPGAGLASTPRYKRAIGMVGATAATEAFVDITGFREAAESMLPADQRARYETDVKPFLEPFESAVMTGSVDASGSAGARAAIVFK